MLAQQRVELAGHEGLETRDAAVAHRGPLVVRAGQDKEPVAQAREGHGAKDLDLFAAHDIGNDEGRMALDPGAIDGRSRSMLVAHSRHQRDAAGLDVDHVPRDVGQAGWTGAVRRLDPALLAARHAGNQAERAFGPHPVTEQCFEHGAESAGRHGQDAACMALCFQHAAVSIHQHRAQRAGAPVDGHPACRSGFCRRHGQWLSRGTKEPRLPRRKSRSTPSSACSTVST